MQFALNPNVSIWKKVPGTFKMTAAMKNLYGEWKKKHPSTNLNKAKKIALENAKGAWRDGKPNLGDFAYGLTMAI